MRRNPARLHNFGSLDSSATSAACFLRRSFAIRARKPLFHRDGHEAPFAPSLSVVRSCRSLKQSHSLALREPYFIGLSEGRRCCTTREDTVWLINPFGHQIVDQYTINLRGAPRLLALVRDKARRIQPGHQSLCASFLVATRSIDLPARRALAMLWSSRALKLSRRRIIVLHGVTVLKNLSILGPVSLKRFLYCFWQTRRQPIRIDPFSRETFCPKTWWLGLSANRTILSSKDGQYRGPNPE